MAEDLRRQISLRMVIVARQMRGRFDKAVASKGVTRAQWTVIAVVASNPGATQRVISEHLEISEVSAGRLVDRLSAEGLVERRRKEDDKRAHAIYLTEAGERLTGELSELARDAERSAFATFSHEELTEMLRLLEKMAVNLGAQPDC